MAGKEGMGERLRMSGVLRPCTGGSTPAAAEEAGMGGQGKKQWMSGGPMRPLGRHAPSVSDKEKMEKAAVTGEKRKAEAAGGSSDGGKATPAADATVEAAPSNGGEDASPEIKFVQMPKELLAWILSQEREGPPKFSYLYSTGTDQDREAIAKLQASFQATQAEADEFFEFQAWVRDKYKKNGKVMVPEDFLR